MLAWLVVLAVGRALEASPPAPPARIVDSPIRYDQARIDLTVAYRREHETPEATDQLIIPRAIVVHFTGGGSHAGTFNYFDRLTVEAGRARTAAAGAVNVSAHFIVDRDGTIYRLMPETWFARHCIGLNHVAIGIENVGDGQRWPLTPEQIAANAWLVRDLVARYPTITHLLGHHEYRRMEGHPYFVERQPRYRNRKPDPGASFMRELRAEVADLALAEPPPETPPTKARRAR